MSKRKPIPRADAEPTQPQPAEDTDWEEQKPFLREALVGFAFVAAPAIVMAVLREYIIATTWLAVGLAIILFSSRRQIWGLLRSSWSRPPKDQPKEKQ